MDRRGRIVAPMTKAQVEVTAGNVRRSLGLGPTSRISMLPFLENVLDEVIPGFQFHVVENGTLGTAEAVTDENRPIIAVTESTYRALRKGEGRARFTAAHEFGHLLLHCGRPYMFAYGLVDDPLTCPERQADIFAAAFLMPAEAFRGLRTVAEATEAFGVSPNAALCRARNLGLRLEHPGAKSDFHRRQLERMIFYPPQRKKERRP